MSERDIVLLLEDILDSCRKIIKYTKGMDFQSFFDDEKTVDAVVRNFEIIGEAANRIDAEFRARHQEIEWNRIRGFRNRIVHEYFGIDYEIVWSIIEEKLDNLILVISKLIDEIKPDHSLD